MAIDLWSLVDNPKQGQRCLRELEYLFLAVNPHRKPLLNVAFRSAPVSIYIFFDGFKVPGRIPLDTKPRTILAIDRRYPGVVC